MLPAPTLQSWFKLVRLQHARSHTLTQRMVPALWQTMLLHWEWTVWVALQLPDNPRSNLGVSSEHHAPVDANSSVGEQVPLQRTIHVTHPIWDWRHDPNVVKVRDEVFSLCKFLLSCLQCAMLTQRVQQRHQRVPLLTPFALQDGVLHTFSLPKCTSTATRRTCGRTEWSLHNNVCTTRPASLPWKSGRRH